MFLDLFSAFPIANSWSHFCDWQMSPSRSIRPDSISHSGDLAVLQKLEEVGSSVKVKTIQLPLNQHECLLLSSNAWDFVQRVQNLIEEHHLQTPEHAA